MRGGPKAVPANGFMPGNAIRIEALTQAQTVQGTRTADASVTDFEAEIGAGKLPAEVFIRTASSHL